jgi:hypothetical protein
MPPRRAIVGILPEPAGARFRGEIGIGGGNNVHIDLDLPLAADGTVLAVLEEAQQRDLCLRR